MVEHNQSNKYKGVGKILPEQLAMRAGKALIVSSKGALSTVLPVIVPVLLILLAIIGLIFLAYASIFILPQHALEESRISGIGKIISLFSVDDDRVTYWTEDDDIRIHQEYLELSDSWREGLDEFQQEQAEQYALPWAILAALDRTIGDPAVNPEAEGDLIVNPKKHYSILKPHFEWKNSKITRVIEWKEEVTSTIYNDEGEAIGETSRIVNRKETKVEDVKLLVLADTYEANYIYEYETITTVEGKATLHSKKVTTTKEVPINVIESGPYYTRLLNLVAEYGLDENPDNVLDFIHGLAQAYDEDYKNSFDVRWRELNSHIDFSKSYYNGSMGETIWPLSSKWQHISSPFGMRLHPVLKTMKLHTGIDIPANRGEPIFAVSDGYVRYSGNMGGYGLTVIIDHGQGIYTLYAHCSKLEVNVGEIVEMGDIIARIGTTGLSTGNHLHFEVRDVSSGDIKYIDPITLY